MTIQLNGHDNSIINICFFCTTSTFYDVLHYILLLRYSCQLEIIYGIGRPPLNRQRVLRNYFPSVNTVNENGAQIADVQLSEAPLCYSSSMAIQNKSECVPVCRKSSVSSVSFCCHVINQSGSMWHSQQPLNCPESLWGRYLMGSVPVVLSRAIASSINCKSRPRFWQRFKSFLKRLV